MIENCFYINLDKRIDRKIHIEKELNKSNLLRNIYKRFPAIDGTTIHPRTLEEGLLSENAICDILSNEIVSYGLSLTQGGLGVLLSYIELFKIISNLDSHALIFEDDGIICNNFDNNLLKIKNQLPVDFDICYLGHGDDNIEKKPYSKDLSIPTGAIFCLPCLLISPNGAKKILKELKNIDNQIDTALYSVLRKLNAFVVNEKLVLNPNQMGTNIQGNSNCIKNYKKQNYIISTLAYGKQSNINAIKLSRDLNFFNQKILVVTNMPDEYSSLENVIIIKYPDKNFSYNDKVICFEEGFKLENAVVYLDADSRIFYEKYKKTYANFSRIISPGFHPSFNWGKITRKEGGFFKSKDVRERTKGYGELALSICDKYKIDINNAFHYQEGIIILSKENKKEIEFIKIWKEFANVLDNYEIKNKSNKIGVGEGNIIGLCLEYSKITINDCRIANLLGNDLKYNFYEPYKKDYYANFPKRKLVRQTEENSLFEKKIEVKFNNLKIDLFFEIHNIDENNLLLVFNWNHNNVIDFIDHEFDINGKIYHFNGDRNNEFYFNKTKFITIKHTYDWYGEKNWKLICENQELKFDKILN